LNLKGDTSNYLSTAHILVTATIISRLDHCFFCAPGPRLCLLAHVLFDGIMPTWSTASPWSAEPRLQLYQKHAQAFFDARYSCITASSPLHSCPYCFHQQMSCNKTWTAVSEAVSFLERKPKVPEHIFEFATYLKITLDLDLPYPEASAAIGSLQYPADHTLPLLKKRLSSLSFHGDSTIQALLYASMTEAHFRCEKTPELSSSGGLLAVRNTRELYYSLATALSNSPGPDPALPRPLIRSSHTLRVSGDVTLAIVMYASCWFGNYAASSIVPIVQTWAAWLPALQSDDNECFIPQNHEYVTSGSLNAHHELEGYNARGAVNFTLRNLIPRIRRPSPLNVYSFRDIMAFRSGMLVSDCVSNDNRDIAAFVQVAAQLIDLLNPSEVRDLWSGQPLLELDRVNLFVRQVKHLVICDPAPRNMAIIYSFLYSLTSPRHNHRIRGRLSPRLTESIVCCPASFGDPPCPSCKFDSDLPPLNNTGRNPVTYILEGVLLEGLSAEEWQANIDARVLLCYEWSRGLQPQLGRYDPYAAGLEVSPLCIRIMLRIGQLI
jgi:hypothetical protein